MVLKRAGHRPRRGRKPGAENMLGHAPPPLTERGLDMRGGRPAFGAAQ